MIAGHDWQPTPSGHRYIACLRSTRIAHAVGPHSAGTESDNRQQNDHLFYVLGIRRPQISGAPFRTGLGGAALFTSALVGLYRHLPLPDR